ncbi:HNH endonuclease [Pseudoalteromonas sp. S4498]|nr:HNH endonuclease [Pseudoalteromonas galatheae]
MGKNRDEFTPNTKRVMAERVAWRCSFPGCGKNTVGPDSADPSKKINNGTAAHICAAAERGPRYDSNMSTEERRAITNGIWMCKDHGALIDSDFSVYSVETLRNWKQEAEHRAAASLRDPTLEKVAQSTTFLQLGHNLVLNVRWKSIDSNYWHFELVSVQIGSQEQLEKYILEFHRLDEHDRFTVIESQGDARELLGIHLETGNENYVVLTVAKKLPVEDPNKVGMDIKLGPDGDLCIENGIQRVKGKDAAIQKVSTSMGIVKGEMKESPWLGSKLSSYYEHYADNLELLARLTKMELIRLSLVPMKKHIQEGKARALPFVKRFNKVSIDSNILKHSRLLIYVELEWGDDSYWKGSIPAFISQDI